MSAYASEQITVSTTSIGITTALIDQCATRFDLPVRRVFVSIESNTIRFRYDGADPTSTVGHPCLANGSFVLEGEGNIRSFRMIRVSGDATATVTLEY